MMVQFCRYNFAAHFNLFSCLFRPGLSLLHWKGPSFNIKALEICCLCEWTWAKKGWETLNIRLWANNWLANINQKLFSIWPLFDVRNKTKHGVFNVHLEELNVWVGETSLLGVVLMERDGSDSPNSYLKVMLHI